MKKKFEEKGYPHDLVEKAFHLNTNKKIKNKDDNVAKDSVGNTARFISTLLILNIRLFLKLLTNILIF